MKLFFYYFLLDPHVDARVAQAGRVPVPGVIGKELELTWGHDFLSTTDKEFAWKVCCMGPLQPLLPGLFLLLLLISPL